MPKICIFWWRVLKNFLPTYGELNRRHIKELSDCPLCGHEVETMYHCMVQCEHVITFWETARDYFDLKLPKLHPVTWAMHILDPSYINMKNATVAVSVMWSIWTSRNKYTHEEVKFQPRKSM
jgi:hypothetical protein